MVNNVAIEYVFVIEYHKLLKEELHTLKEYISTNALSQEEYHVNVGKVQAITMLKDKFELLIKENFGQEL